MDTRSWYYVVNGQKLGPEPERVIQEKLRSGILPPSTMVWTVGMDQWAAASSIASLGSFNPYTATAHSAGPSITYYDGFRGYAGFWKRFAAVFIDGLLLSFIGGFVGCVSGFAFAVATAGKGNEGAEILLQLLLNLFNLIVAWSYHAILESSSYQATLGKMAIGIKVTDANGQRISFARATGRHFGKILSFFTILIGYMMAGWTERKQALHDMLAGCLVVNK